MRPRATAKTAAGAPLGDDHASVDVSSTVALVLLVLIAGEIALRLWTTSRVHGEEATT
jgi:hypothetical protein